MHPRTLSLVPLALLAGLLPAQTAKVIPAPWATVEGNSRSTYPFGRQDAAIQVLTDAPQVTTATAILMGLSFRADGWPDNTYSGYQKAHKVTAYTTPTTAAGMSKDPIANRGGPTSPGTVLFDGNLSLPNSAPPAVLPRPWSVRFAFTSVYTYDSTKGNLLLEVATNDTTTPPGNWTIDAVNIRTTGTIEGQRQQVSAGCSGGGSTLTLKLADGKIGGNLDIAFTSNTNGAFPQLLAMVGASISDPGFPIDLTPAGMPGCTLDVNPIWTIPVLENATGGYPSLLFPISNSQTMVGLTAYVQALGWTTKPTLNSSAMTPAWSMTVGDSAPVVTSQMAFYVASTGMWSLGAGQYVPVFRLEGVFP